MLLAIKIFSFICIILHITLSVQKLFLWSGLSIGIIMLLFFLSPMKPGELLKRNILIFSFIFMISIFYIITAYIRNNPVITLSFIQMCGKIFFTYNIVILFTAWLSLRELSKVISSLPFPSIRIFMFAVYRQIQTFKRAHSRIIFQIRSRLDKNNSSRYLIPRFYVMNFITRELHTLQYFQGGLITRFSNDNTPEAAMYQNLKSDIVQSIVFFFISSLVFTSRFWIAKVI